MCPEADIPSFDKQFEYGNYTGFKNFSLFPPLPDIKIAFSKIKVFGFTRIEL